MPLMQMVLSATVPGQAFTDLADILQLWANERTDITLILQGDLSADTLADLKVLLARLQERPDAQVLTPLLRELHLGHRQEEEHGEA